MPRIDTAPIPPESHALSALGWILADEARARRFLDLTGLTPETLRVGLARRDVQAAILAFLEAHEPDLIACAAVIGTTPAALVAARESLER